MNATTLFSEPLTSRTTELLVLALTLLFLGRAGWRTLGRELDRWAIALLVIGVFFLFYSFNDATLHIRLTAQLLSLRFGIFEWATPLRNTEACALDPTSLWRIGGAGIQFTPLGRRYRVMLDFLEYPRQVLKLKTRRGPVRDVAFSTRRPQGIAKPIQQASAVVRVA